MSLLAHVLTGALLYRWSPEPAALGGDDAIVLDFDIDEAPEAPEADMPVDDQGAPMDDESDPDDASDPEETAEDEVPVAPELDPEDDVVEIAAIDAGVPDAAVEIAAIDAGVPDAAVEIAAIDAGVPDAAVEIAAIDAGVPDAAIEIAAIDAGPLDAGLLAGVPEDAGADGGVQVAVVHAEELAPAAQTGDAGVPDDALAQGPAIPDIGPSGLDIGLAPALTSLGGSQVGTSAEPGAGGGERRKPSQANLLAYLPKGELVTVLIRFDRMRDTEWAARTEAILAPMPDYRSLVGGRKIALAEQFPTMVVSSPEPREVTATTVLVRTAMNRAKMRSFLDHKLSRVTWSSARGGPLGRRQRSRLVAPHDQRVFMIPFPDWVVLTHPKNLGKLMQPSAGALDRVAATTAEFPAWLSAVRAIERESGEDSGPALVVTVARILPETWDTQLVGVLPTPEALTLALEVTEKGFFVRGTMVFADASTATAFVTAAKRSQSDLVETRLGKAMLDQVKAYNAVRGLSFAQNKEKVGFATSVSVADGRAAMDFAASQTRRFFLRGAGRRPPRKAPAGGGKNSKNSKPGKNSKNSKPGKRSPGR